MSDTEQQQQQEQLYFVPEDLEAAGPPRSADSSKYYKSYPVMALEPFVQSVSKLVGFITLVTLLLFGVVLLHDELPLTQGDRIHLFMVIAPLFLISLVSMVVFRREPKTLLVVLVLVSMFNGYAIAYVGHVVSEKLAGGAAP